VKSVLLGLFVLALTLCGCRNAVGSDATLTVFAAASLTEAFTEIGRHFQEAHPGTSVTFNFAGSQELAQQLSQGAPAHVFASANQRQMEQAITAGRVDEQKVRIFAHNRLLIILPPGNPGQIDSLQDLARPGVQLLLADEAVPAGQYSREVLRQATTSGEYGATYEQSVLDNVVSFEQNVRGVLTKISLGEADAGIVYASDLTAHNSTAGAEALLAVQIPERYNVTAAYPIAPVVDSANRSLAQSFIEFVTSPAGQSILADHGFIPAAAE
jgi:molybdate transport system substrate-binding protein